jgi:uroporphyrinogen-III decarboxylase
MNSLERMRYRLRGDPVDRPPNFDIMMTFAAHAIGQPLARYYLDYRVLCEANLAMIEQFDLDIAQAISDPYRESADLGAEYQRCRVRSSPGDAARQPARSDPSAEGDRQRR